MRRPTASCLLLIAGACGAHISDSGPVGAGPVDAGAGLDGAGDALVLGAWSTPVPVGVAATPAEEDDVTLSSNALEMIFAVAGMTGKDLYYTSRAAIGAPWEPIARLPFDSAASEETPRFSGDDRTLYFASDRGTSGSLDIYAVTRSATGNASWDTPRALSAINTAAVEKWFTPCGTDRYVVVRSRADGTTDLFEGTLGGGAPVAIDALDSAANETGAFLTRDCLTIYFTSNRTLPIRIYVSTRAAITQPWQPPSVVTEFPIGNGGDDQEDPWLSSDGRTFGFASDASGSKDVYLSTR